MALFLDVKAGETVHIWKNCKISLVSKFANTARLHIDSSDNLTVEVKSPSRGISAKYSQMPIRLDMTVGDIVIINSQVEIQAEKKAGRKVRLKIDADKTVPIELEPLRGRNGTPARIRPPHERIQRA